MVMRTSLVLLLLISGFATAQQRPPQFEGFPVRINKTGHLAPVNVRSHRFANRFRTVLRAAIKRQRINFAGKYTVTTIGSGNICYWAVIVDRLNGRAYVAPFNYRYGYMVKPDSRLFVIDSKGVVAREFGNSDAAESFPAYFLWKENRLVQIGPRNYRPQLIDECPYNELVRK